MKLFYETCNEMRLFWIYRRVIERRKIVSETSMEQIYQEHAQSVYKFLLSLSHDSTLSEELTQETFYRAIYSIDRFDGSCKISVWLCQIAKHIWYQELDKGKKMRTQELTNNIPVSTSTPEDTFILSSDKVGLYKAIHSLNDSMREVVYLRLTGEFTFSEIGEILEKNENWARTTFYRAKQKIREVM